MKFHGMCPSGLFLKEVVITQHLLPLGIESSNPNLELALIWEFHKARCTFLGLHNKDCSILGSMLGSPYFGELP